MRVLITGGSGQLGRALTKSARTPDVLAVGQRHIDVSNFDAVWEQVKRFEPDLIIHAGAMTDVDGCEREPERAWSINALGTQHVAAAAADANASLVYISTNFVFDGEQDEPYHEFAQPNPLSIYGASKLAGEEAVRAICPRHYIVRTAMVFDEVGRNFVNTMLRLAVSRSSLTVVSDQTGNPTYAADLAKAIWALVERPAYGTFHLTNSGVASWYEWAIETFRLSNANIEVSPISAADYPRAATPPKNGVLANLAGHALGISLPMWQDALFRCLNNRASLLAAE